jgi:hypothetical protein
VPSFVAADKRAEMLLKGRLQARTVSSMVALEMAVVAVAKTSVKAGVTEWLMPISVGRMTVEGKA